MCLFCRRGRATERLWWRLTLPKSIRSRSSTSCWLTLGILTRNLGSKLDPFASSASLKKKKWMNEWKKKKGFLFSFYKYGLDVGQQRKSRVETFWGTTKIPLVAPTTPHPPSPPRSSFTLFYATCKFWIRDGVANTPFNVRNMRIPGKYFDALVGLKKEKKKTIQRKIKNGQQLNQVMRQSWRTFEPVAEERAGVRGN